MGDQQKAMTTPAKASTDMVSEYVSILREMGAREETIRLVEETNSPCGASVRSPLGSRST